MSRVLINDLPLALSDDDAVEVVYRDELDWAESTAYKMREQLSALADSLSGLHGSVRRRDVDVAKLPTDKIEDVALRLRALA